MKARNIRLLKEADKSFILYKENNPFSEYHYHPKYELVLITRGQGKRMVGDHIDRFKDNDLVLLGANLPHEWLCDPDYFEGPEGFSGEGRVIQFHYDFLGDKFFDVFENLPVKEILAESARGIEFSGKTKQDIIELLLSMFSMSGTNSLYTLMKIFHILSQTNEKKLLASPSYYNGEISQRDDPMQKSLNFILQNFQNPIQINDILEIISMSNTSFYETFKRTYRMSFKDYLIKIRIGYACKLLIEDSLNISEVAYYCGFENLSNFNRQFKKIMGETPSNYKKEIKRDRIPT